MHTDEDRALDRMLAQREVDVPAGVDLTPGPTLRKTIENPLLLSEHVENYEPAKNLATLEEQVFLSLAHGADSIEVTDMVFKAIFGYVPAEDYAIYKNIKMYKIGQVEAGRAKDARTVEQVLFGNSKPVETLEAKAK